MRKLLIVILTAMLGACAVVLTCSAVRSNTGQISQAEADSLFEVAVGIIKKYETMHRPKDWPFVGYGHGVLPGEKFNRRRTLTEAEADALLRKDLRKNMAVFSKYGADSLILGVLAYNIGHGRVQRSSIVKKLAAGDRNIQDVYLSYCRYNGKLHKGIKNRRIEEFENLFIKVPSVTHHSNLSH